MYGSMGESVSKAVSGRFCIISTIACGILFLAVLYILFSSFFAYFLFPKHYTLIFQGCKSYQSMRSFLTHKKTDALVIHHSEGIQTF